VLSVLAVLAANFNLKLLLNLKTNILFLFPLLSKMESKFVNSVISCFPASVQLEKMCSAENVISSRKLYIVCVIYSSNILDSEPMATSGRWLKTDATYSQLTFFKKELICYFCFVTRILREPIFITSYYHNESCIFNQS